MNPSIFNFLRIMIIGKVRTISLLCIVSFGIQSQVKLEKIEFNNSHQLKVKLNHSDTRIVYLGHYFGYDYPLVDSAYLDYKKEFVFRGNFPLSHGLYIIYDSQGEFLFDFIIDSNQHFKIEADLMNPQDPKLVFKGSKDNDLFLEYKKNEYENYRNIEDIGYEISNAKSEKDSNYWKSKREYELESINSYKDKIIVRYPNSFVSLMLKAIQIPTLPLHLRLQKNKLDSTNARQYIKSNYWNGVYLWDGRLSYTPFLGPKLDRYLTEVITQEEDSIKKEIDWIMISAMANEKMNQFVLKRILKNILGRKYKWGDEIFVHIFEKYIAPKNYSWITESDKAYISERAYFAMGKLINKPAPDINLPGLDGLNLSLYSIKAKYTIICFWDPTCHHCRETLPQLDSFQRLVWQKNMIKVFCLASESSGNIEDWKTYIHEYKLSRWGNVYNSISEETKRYNAGEKSYAQLYDVWYYPSFFLVDEKKRFIAKKLSFKQITELLNVLLNK